MGFTTYSRKKLLDHILNIATYTPPTSLYVSLHTASPTDAGLFTSEVSTVGTGYVRQPIATKMSATDSGTGVSTNTANIVFPTISEEYGTITHIGLSDAETAGNMCAWGAISEPQNKTVGEAFQFTAGQISISLI